MDDLTLDLLMDMNIADEVMERTPPPFFSGNKPEPMVIEQYTSIARALLLKSKFLGACPYEDDQYDDEHYIKHATVNYINKEYRWLVKKALDDRYYTPEYLKPKAPYNCVFEKRKIEEYFKKGKYPGTVCEIDTLMNIMNRYFFTCGNEVFYYAATEFSFQHETFLTLRLLSMSFEKLRQTIQYKIFQLKDTKNGIIYHYVREDGVKYKGATSIVNLWLEHTNRRSTDIVVFEPSQRHGDPPTGPTLFDSSCSSFFNKYRGLEYLDDALPIQDNEFIQMFQVLVNSAICANDKESQKFVWAWLLEVLFGEQKTNMMLTLYSRAQGTGKSTFALLLSILIGDSARITTPRNVIDGQFSGPFLQGATLVVLDEEKNQPGFEKKGEYLNSLKNRITDEHISLEKKRVQHDGNTYAKDFTNYIATTNNYPAYLEFGIENRRFSFFEVSDVLKGNKEFWTQFRLYLKDRNQLKDLSKFLYYIWRMELFKLKRDCPPITLARSQAMLANIDPVQNFVRDILLRKRIGNISPNLYRDRVFDPKSPTFPAKVSLEELTNHAKNFLKNPPSDLQYRLVVIMNDFFKVVFKLEDSMALVDIPCYEDCVSLFCEHANILPEHFLMSLTQDKKRKPDNEEPKTKTKSKKKAKTNKIDPNQSTVDQLFLK
jgi:hypothetical protein